MNYKTTAKSKNRGVMKHPITKLRIVIRNFYGKRRRSTVSQTLREANIEPKWWMGEHIIISDNQAKELESPMMGKQ